MSAEQLLIRAALLTMSLGVPFVMWRTLHLEYYSHIFLQDTFSRPYQWLIHHDEKHAALEGRVWINGPRNGMRIADYFPFPISVTWGVFGPLLTFAGLKACGVNNRGLRLSCPLVAAAVNLLTCHILLAVVPGAAAVPLAGFFILNCNTFVLFRHNVPENILTLLLVAVTDVAAVAPAFFLAHMGLLAFVCGLGMTIKWHMPVLTYALVWLLGWGLGAGAAELMWSAPYFLAGLVFFEGLNSLVLWRMGLLHERFTNMARVVNCYQGRSTDLVHGVPQNNGVQAIAIYLENFLNWFIHPQKSRAMAWLQPALMLAVAALFAAQAGHLYGPAAAFQEHPRRLMTGLFAFNAANLVFISLSYVYLKRLVSLIPLTYILLCALAGQVLAAAPHSAPALTAALWAGLLASLYFQRRTITELDFAGSRGLEDLARQLDRTVPEGSVIFTDGMAFRMFWMSERRFVVSDELCKSPGEIIGWALANNADYVLLWWRDPSVLNASHLVALDHMADWRTTPCESGMNLWRYDLYKVKPAYRAAGGAS